MAEYATLPRGMRIPSLFSGGQQANGHLPNGHSHGASTPSATFHRGQQNHVPVVSISNCVPNGSITANGSAGGRAVHDGFATIRAGGKRGRARSSPSVIGENKANQCHHGCCPTLGRTWGMEPLWEEKGSLDPNGGAAPQVTRRERQQLPWWEIATRRSRYRSCPAFSQASVVSALEQTMSNVTNQLERLASSPDLKESEAAELRKTAAFLRQQSSAVCQSVSSGYFTMERQLSCDSVSSVTSTVSGASLSSYASMASRSVPGTLSQHYSHNQFHHQSDPLGSSDSSKIKKRSWLRNSFRRAFGRHGRKRSKQSVDGNLDDARELPMHHAVNSAVKNLAAPPPPYWTLVKQQQPTGKTLSRESSRQFEEPVIRIEHQNGSQEDSELVTNLRKELADKERELTDCRLEVLSTQHQLQSQSDTITRLQAEVTGLREENNKLLSLMRGQCSPTTDALLTPLSHTLNALTLNQGSTTGNNLAIVSGRQVRVMVVEQSDISAVNHATVMSLKPSYLTHIGNVNVESKTTWEEFDKLIANTLKDYGNRIDPVSALGLDNDSIFCYRVDDAVRSPDHPLPELLPYGYCVGSIDALHVWLKGGNLKKDTETIGNVSLAAFSSVTPASSLKRLASQLIEHRRLLLAGNSACGKSTLAQTLAKFFITNSGREYTPDAIKTFTVTGSNTLELCQLLSSMWPRGLSSSCHSSSSASSNASVSSSSSLSSSITSPEAEVGPPAVIIIDDLHAASGVVETLQRCLPTSVHIGPAIIATSCPTTSLATRLHINCNFKWATLGMQQEPVRGLLGRVLRRRVVAAEVAANTRLPDAHHLAEWLTRLWLHLNTLLSGHCSSPEVGVGPGLLMDSPLGQEETQVWFTEVWNSRLVPYIKDTVKASTSPNSVFDTWTDPLDWVLATYPWPVNAACGPDQLIRITASDIGKQEANLLSKKLSPHEPYVPLSVRQQMRKAESIYSTPQLLPMGKTHGTGQNIFSNKDIKFMGNDDNINRKDSVDNIYHSISKVDTAQIISNLQEVDKSMEILKAVDNTTVNCYMENKINTGDKSNTNKVIGSKEDLNSKPGSPTEENQVYKTCINATESSNPYSSVSSLIENNRYEKDNITKVCEEMDSENIPLEVDGSIPYFFDGYINSLANKNVDSKDIPTEMESKFEKLSDPQNLEVLAKNALNSNGPSPDCLKIIRGNDAKIDIRGLSSELTSTFKPSETAI